MRYGMMNWQKTHDAVSEASITASRALNRRGLLYFVPRVSEKNIHSYIGYKWRSGCLILIILDTKIPHVI